MLAHRTQKLIEEVKPDRVLVMTNAEWWNNARNLKYVDSQEELNKYNDVLDRHANNKFQDIYFSSKRWLSYMRWYVNCFLYQWHFRFDEVNVFRPGIEIKQACEAAEKVGAKIEFLGPEFDQATWARIHHDTRIGNAFDYFSGLWQYRDSFYPIEREGHISRLRNVGGQAWTEKCLDTYAVNWYIANASIYFPKMKRILVDNRDEDLFKKIDSSEGKRVVVVVNQWHMEGIEHLWCNRYGQLPRSVEFPEGINPIGDMNLREGLFSRYYNALHREIASKNSKTYPVTYADWIIGYHREANWQYEHRDM